MEADFIICVGIVSFFSGGLFAACVIFLCDYADRIFDLIKKYKSSALADENK